jgi:MFS transporter, SP family, galactose:H+ symporter
VIGTLISGMLSSKLGRRKTILVSAVIFVLGSVLCSISPSEHLLIGARLFLGVAVGVASFTAPLYLSEISPQKMRGSLISLYQLNDYDRNSACVSEQYLARLLCDVWRVTGGHWRIMPGVIAVPGAIMFLGVLFLPESQR